MQRDLQAPRRHRHWLVTLVAAGLATSALAYAQNPAAPPNTANELLLEQLRELREEIRYLRAEVSVIREAVTALHRAQVQPAAAPTPQPTRLNVKLDGDDPVLGNPHAQVALIEFGDYQCPFCARFHRQTFPELKKRYLDTGKIKYIYRDFPLGFHPEARGAAVAANCAGQQNAYWEMKNRLFANQRRLGGDLYRELADTLTLDEGPFRGCLARSDQAREVEKDLTYGQSLGVSGTPTFFIGRIDGNEVVSARRIVGAQTFSAFASVIDALLAEAAE